MQRFVADNRDGQPGYSAYAGILWLLKRNTARWSHRNGCSILRPCMFN